MFFVVKNRAEPVRVALLSDTHGTLDTRIAERVAACDYAVHTGDIGTWQVIEALQPRRAAPIAVRGNNDTPAAWPVGERTRLASLPAQAELQLPGGLLVAVHGHRHGAPGVRHARLRACFPTARAIVYGHSHRLICDTDAEPWVLNPGAAGRARTFGGPSCLVLTVDERQWQVEVVRFTTTARVPRAAVAEPTS